MDEYDLLSNKIKPHQVATLPIVAFDSKSILKFRAALVIKADLRIPFFYCYFHPAFIIFIFVNLKFNPNTARQNIVWTSYLIWNTRHT